MIKDNTKNMAKTVRDVEANMLQRRAQHRAKSVANVEVKIILPVHVSQRKKCM